MIKNKTVKQFNKSFNSRRQSCENSLFCWLVVYRKALSVPYGSIWTGTGCCVSAVCPIQSPEAAVLLLNNCETQKISEETLKFDGVRVVLCCFYGKVVLVVWEAFWVTVLLTTEGAVANTEASPNR